MDYIGVEWEKMIHGQEVDENVISPVVNKSWLRCIKAGVDPYKIDEKIFLKKEEIDYYKNSPYIKVDKELLLILQKIADKFDLSFLIFDNKCKLVKILACSEKIQNIASDSSENIIGTNSICLAIIHKMPIQVFGKEHYNKLLHQYNCSAAPI